jgi:glc operon protein GlcG
VVFDRSNAGGREEVPWEPFASGSHSIRVHRFNDHQRGVLIMRVAVSCLVALALSAAAGAAQAQVTQTKKVLTLEGAKLVATAAAAEAKKGNEGASIAIVDDGGNLIYLERIQPTFPMGATISTEKARTAALFQKPTKILEDAIVAGRTPLLNAWSAPLNGGEPIVADGQVVGAIGVSGASSAARDAAIALAGVAAAAVRTSANR